MLVIPDFRLIRVKSTQKKESNKETIKYTIHLSSTNLLTSCISNDSNIIQTMQIYIHIHKIKFQFVSNSWFQINTCKINTKKESNKETIKYTIHLSSTNLLTPCISNDSNIIQTMQIYIHIHKIKFQFVSNSWFQINTCKINTKKRVKQRNN